MSWQLGEIHKHKTIVASKPEQRTRGFKSQWTDRCSIASGCSSCPSASEFFSRDVSTTDYQVALLIPLLVHTDCDGKGPRSSLECKAFVLSVSYQRPLRILQMRVLSVRYLHFIELNTTMKLYPHQT